MKVPKIETGDLIEVMWIDANSPRSCFWMTEGELADRLPRMEIRSVGYFFREIDEYLVMKGDMSDSDEYEKVINRVFSIPVGCITEIHRLKKERFMAKVDPPKGTVKKGSKKSKPATDSK